MKNSLLLNKLVNGNTTTTKPTGDDGPAEAWGDRANEKEMLSFNLASRGDVKSGRAASAMRRMLQRNDSDMHLDLSDCESDDALSSASVSGGRNNTPATPANKYWDDFDNAIKLINDNTQYFALKPKPNFKSSDVFKGVMTDMYGNTEYGTTRGYTKLKEKISKLSNISGLASRMLARAATTTEIDIEPDENDEEENDDKEKAELKSEAVGAKRSWKILKRHVKETTMEKNTEQTKLNWDMITHHVKGMTDLEKARDDLYKRYGVIPTVQENGKLECRNIMWSERAIRLNQTNPGQYNVYSHQKSKRRAQSARPPRPKTANSSKPDSTGNPRPASETGVRTTNHNSQSSKRNAHINKPAQRPKTSQHSFSGRNLTILEPSKRPSSERINTKWSKDSQIRFS